jgi:Uma2 family endonuclease
MTAEPAAKITPQEYLALERQSEIKSEYWNGEMFAMAGATEAHNLIVANVVGEVRTQLKGRPCKMYPNDMRVRIPHSLSYKYPDVVIVCGRSQFEDEHHDTLLNPMAIIEVLSPSTEAYDRGGKFGEYRTIDSLQEYVLISQDKPLIERYVRQEDSPFWLFSDAKGMEMNVELRSIGCTLALAEVYDKVEFE